MRRGGERFLRIIHLPAALAPPTAAAATAHAALCAHVVRMLTHIAQQLLQPERQGVKVTAKAACEQSTAGSMHMHIVHAECE